MKRNKEKKEQKVKARKEKKVKKVEAKKEKKQDKIKKKEEKKTKRAENKTAKRIAKTTTTLENKLGTVIRSFGRNDDERNPIGEVRFPMEPVKSLGIIGDSEPRGLSLNRQFHAKDNKEKVFYEELVLAADEYINQFGVIFSSGDQNCGTINGVSFTTNLGRVIQAASYESYLKDGKYHKYELNDIRVLEVGGAFYKKGLSRVTIKYDNLAKSSNSLFQDSNARGEFLAVTRFQSPFTTVTTYESAQVNRLFAATRIREAIFSTSTTAAITASNEVGMGKAQAKFEAALSTSFGLETTVSSEIHEQFEDIISKSKTVTKEIPEGYIGLEVVKVKLFEEVDSEAEEDSDEDEKEDEEEDSEEDESSGGFVWMYPVGEPQLLTVPVDAEIGGGIYDLTGALTLIMPHLESRLSVKNSFNWIKKVANDEVEEK